MPAGHFHLGEVVESFLGQSLLASIPPFRGCATSCVAAENSGRRWIGVDISPKPVELVNIRLQQSMGDLFHNRLVTARTDILRRTAIDAPVPSVRTSTSCAASRKLGATGAAASSRSASLRWTTSSPVEAAASTTSRTCSCCAPTATGSRETDRKNTCWPGCGSWVSQRD